MRLLGFKLELWKTDHDVAQCQSVRMRSNVTDGIALRHTQTITQIQAQAPLPASFPSTLVPFQGLVAMALWLYPGMWPPDLDQMVPPSHLFDLGRATYAMKYYHVGSGRAEEWLVLLPKNRVSFIRRTKKLGLFWLT